MPVVTSAASNSGSLVQVVSTAAESQADPAEVWPHFVRQTCGALQVVPRPGFASGSITSTTLGDMRLAIVRADPHTVIRQPSVARSEAGHIYVATMVRGRALVRQNESEVAVYAGDVAAFDSSRPYSLTMDEPFELISVRARHEAVGLNQRDTSFVAGTVWPGSAGVGALARDALTSVGTLMAQLDEAVREPLGSTLSGVVSTLFA